MAGYNFADHPLADVCSQAGFPSCFTPIILCAFREIKVFLLLFLSAKVETIRKINNATKNNVFPKQIKMIVGLPGTLNYPLLKRWPLSFVEFKVFVEPSVLVLQL